MKKVTDNKEVTSDASQDIKETVTINPMTQIQNEMLNAQTVRTSFRLTNEAMRGLRKLAEHYELDFKGVLNTFALNADVISSMVDPILKKPDWNSQVWEPRKTFVISHGTKVAIDTVATKLQHERDSVLSALIIAVTRSLRETSKDQLSMYVNARQGLEEHWKVLDQQLFNLFYDLKDVIDDAQSRGDYWQVYYDYYYDKLSEGIDNEIKRMSTFLGEDEAEQ